MSKDSNNPENIKSIHTLIQASHLQVQFFKLKKIYIKERKKEKIYDGD